MLWVRSQFSSGLGLTISHHPVLFVHQKFYNIVAHRILVTNIFFFAFVGDYYSLSCEPTLGENQIFHSMVKRQVMKTRDAIKLIGDGKAQKLKKDKVIESWIKVDIGTVRAKKKFMSFLSKTTSQWKEFFCLFFVCFSVVLDWLDFLASRNQHLEKDWSHSKGPMNKHLKPDRDTNLNDPRSEVDRLDCNPRLVWSSVVQKIEFSIAKSGFRLA